MPRKHFKFIDNLSADKIIEEKNRIITEMAQNLGIPPETLMETMYQKEAARKAKIELDAIAAQEKKEAELAAAEAVKAGAEEEIAKPEEKDEKIAAL